MSKKRAKARRRQKQRGILGNRTLIIGTVVVAVVVVGLVLLGRATSPSTSVDLDEVPDNSEEIPIQGREHIAPGDAHAGYNSNPPTSGPHTSSLPTDVYTRVMNDENLVHNLEHGHIWLSYRDTDDQEAINLLSDVQGQYPNLVIVTHRPQNDDRVAVASWGRLLRLNGELDSDEIIAFIQRYSNQSPEVVPG